MWHLMGAQEEPTEQDQKDPNQAAYLSRFGAPLPAIPAQNSPQPSADNQMIPYGGHRTHLAKIEQPPMVGPDHTDGRVRHIEGRLAMMEQSNRALLEEVVRLQGELKSSHRRTEEAIQAERQARQQLTENIRGSNDLIGQLGARLKRAEEKVADERSAVSALTNHTKQVEQAVLGGQQELLAKRDQQMTKIAELRNDLDEANRLREHLERATTTMVDELRQLKNKVDTNSIEYGGTLHDMKERTKRLEEEQRQAVEHLRKSQEIQHASEQSATLLRTQLDARLGEVRDVMMDLRNRVTAEETERRQREQSTQIRVNELQSQVHEQNRKHDESMHAMDVMHREREHAVDSERLKMQGKIAEIAEEVSRKILSKEIKLREEAQQKFGNVEKYLHAEQAARIAFEQTLREENEKRWEALKKVTEEEVVNVREGQKLDRHKNIGTISKVGEMIDKLEKQQVDTRKQLEVVMKAEIKSRQSQDKQIENKIDDVQDKLGVAISTLQQAIAGMSEQMVQSNNEDIQLLISILGSRGDPNSLISLMLASQKQEQPDNEKLYAASEFHALASIPEQMEDDNDDAMTFPGARPLLGPRPPHGVRPALSHLNKGEGYEIHKWLDALKEEDPEKLAEYDQDLLDDAQSEYQSKVKAMMAENTQGGIRGLADLDARLVGLQTRLATHEETTEEKMQEILKAANDDKGAGELKRSLEAQQERLEELNDWKDSADKKLKGMRERMDELGPEIREISQSNDNIRSDAKTLVETEAKDRVRDVQMIRQEFEGKFTQLQAELEKKAEPQAAVVPPMPVSQKEKLAQGKGAKLDDATKARIDSLQEESEKARKNLDEIKEEVSKVDNSIQTVRVHLTRKIEGETKSRRKDLQDLQDTFEDLKFNLSPLLDQAAAIEEAMKNLEKKGSKESRDDSRSGSRDNDRKSDEREKESSKDGKGRGGDKSPSRDGGSNGHNKNRRGSNSNNSNSNREDRGEGSDKKRSEDGERSGGGSKERAGKDTGKDDRKRSDKEGSDDKERRRKERDERKTRDKSNDNADRKAKPKPKKDQSSSKH